MRNDRSAQQKTDNSAGVSEIIGAVLLISLVVIAIGIIAAMLFGQQTPTKIPNMNFITGVSADQHTLYLSHTGGDPLNLNEFSVVLDGVQASSPTVSGGGSQWSLGKTLIVPILKVPQNVQIVYNSSGSAGAVLLRQAANVNTTVNLTADQIPYLDCSAVANPTCLANIPSQTINTMYFTNTTQKLIRFKASNQPRGTIPGGAGAAYHFNFTVAADNSSIVIGATGSDTCAGALRIHNLKNGDKVGIILTASPDSFYIYGIGPEIWYMNIGGRTRVTIEIINQTTTTTYTGTNALCSAYIKQYTNLDSSIDITTATTNVIMSLSVNNTPYINGVNTSTITLQNVVPIDNGLFLVTFGAAGEPVYFLGWADSISGLTPPLGL